MKVNYKGFELNASREKCLGGWSMLYFQIVTPTGYYLVDSFEDSDETVRDQIKYMKETVDDYIKNPQDYEEDGKDYFVEEETESIYQGRYYGS